MNNRRGSLLENRQGKFNCHKLLKAFTSCLAKLILILKKYWTHSSSTTNLKSSPNALK